MYIFTKSRPSRREKIDCHITSESVKFKVDFNTTSWESSASAAVPKKCAIFLRIVAHIACLAEYTFCP